MCSALWTRAFFNNVLLGSDGHALNGGCSRWLNSWERVSHDLCWSLVLFLLSICPVLREQPEFYAFPPDVLGGGGMKNWWGKLAMGIHFFQLSEGWKQESDWHRKPRHSWPWDWTQTAGSTSSPHLPTPAHPLLSNRLKGSCVDRAQNWDSVW